MSVEVREPRFNRKFRESWRYGSDKRPQPTNGVMHDSPESMTSRGHYNSQRETQLRQIEEIAQSPTVDKHHIVRLLQEKEDEIQGLQEELETAYFQRNEIQDALGEAQTIIEQQQDQLTEFRRRAAQSAADAETYKMKNMFLSASNRDDQMEQMNAACTRLEAEVEALTWQVDQAKRSETRAISERDYLQQQLQDLKEGVNSASASASSAGPAMEVEANKRELNELRGEVAQLREEKKEWHRTHDQLVTRQRELEEERALNESRFMMLKAQSGTSQRDSPENVSGQGSRSTPCPDGEIQSALRRATEERDRWRSYASRLVRGFVENCDEFIKKTPYEEPEFYTAAERRWYEYTMQHLELLLEVAPERLARTDLELLKRSTSSQMATPALNNSAPFGGSTEVLSAVVPRHRRHMRKSPRKHR
ncbi:unnamed protein product [Calicophoron daubneyi]|uniref:Uncharacterized protein n=1 Tax=Calicophoron daubneyi TaxID=300641 RepID=A0AAV2TPH1_CALDB